MNELDIQQRLSFEENTCGKLEQVQRDCRDVCRCLQRLASRCGKLRLGSEHDFAMLCRCLGCPVLTGAEVEATVPNGVDGCELVARNPIVVRALDGLNMLGSMRQGRLLRD